MAEEEEVASPPPEPEKKGGSKLPIIAVALAVVLAPAVTWAVSTFVIIPQMRTAVLGEEAKASAEDASHGAGQGGEGTAEGGTKEASSYRFQDLVVNLAGTMGTRYLRTTFIVVGESDRLNRTFTSNEMATPIGAVTARSRSFWSPA